MISKILKNQIRRIASQAAATKPPITSSISRSSSNSNNLSTVNAHVKAQNISEQLATSYADNHSLLSDDNEFLKEQGGSAVTMGNEQLYTCTNWSTSFQGMAMEPFSQKAIDILLSPINENDIEVKPDGLLYLPEIKYRRILNRAFGPGAWGIAPRGPHTIINRTLTREYALIVHGRFVSQARGEQDFFSPDSLPTATEGVKSNALMRCCKDLGIASELWDPVFIRKWKSINAVEVWVTDLRSKQKKKLWRRKDEKLSYPYQE